MQILGVSLVLGLFGCGGGGAADAGADSDSDTDVPTDSDSESATASETESDTPSETDTGPCAGCDATRGECIADECRCGDGPACEGSNADLCCADGCIDVTMDPANCGDCGVACTACERCGAGRCDVRADPCIIDEDCGDCGPCFCPGPGVGCTCLGTGG